MDTAAFTASRVTAGALLTPDQVWATLWRRQTSTLVGRACPEFFRGLDILGLPADRVPDLDEVARRLEAKTGWTLEPVDRVMDIAPFFRMLARGAFPLIRHLRPAHELEFASAPDLWHDLFGHVPFLVHPAVARLYRLFGQAGVAALERDATDLTRGAGTGGPVATDLPAGSFAAAGGLVGALSAIYWYTIEFGLIRSPDGVRVYGAGILPSPTESAHALSAGARHTPLTADRVAHLPFTDAKLQDDLYVVDSFEALEQEVWSWANRHGLV